MNQPERNSNPEREMSDSLSFSVTDEEAAIITKIARRAVAMDREINGRLARKLLDWRMDFTATHASGRPLRLIDLLNADDFNFAHDAFGIERFLDRSTGQLTGFFAPRFSVRVKAAAA